MKKETIDELYNESIEQCNNGNMDKAVKIWELLVYEGHESSFSSLSNMYSNPSSKYQDLEKYRNLYELAHKLKIPFMMHNLAANYSSGFAFEKDLEKSFEIIKETSDLGHRRATYMVGYKLYYGEGTNRDIKKAKNYFEKCLDMEGQLAEYEIESAKDLIKKIELEESSEENEDNIISEDLDTNDDDYEYPSGYSIFDCLDEDDFLTEEEILEMQNEPDERENFFIDEIPYEFGTDEVEKAFREGVENSRKKKKGLLNRALRRIAGVHKFDEDIGEFENMEDYFNKIEERNQRIFAEEEIKEKQRRIQDEEDFLDMLLLHYYEDDDKNSY